MSTTQTRIPLQTTTPPQAPQPLPPTPSGRGPRRSHRVALILGAAAVVAVGAAVAVGVAVNQSGTTPSSVPPAAAFDTTGTSMYLTSYGPGSTVYAGQVPAAASSWTDAYAPGSTVYAEQVPAVPAPRTDAYGPGSTVYNEQVPRYTTTVWTSAYGPGSAVYSEQVPQS